MLTTACSSEVGSRTVSALKCINTCVPKGGTLTKLPSSHSPPGYLLSEMFGFAKTLAVASMALTYSALSIAAPTNNTIDARQYVGGGTGQG
jgi:hypothetical protein